MREVLWFVASLAGAAILTALAILVSPKSPIWRTILWGAAYILLVCAVLIFLDMRRPLRDRNRMLPLIGLVIFGIAFLGCSAWYFWPTRGAAKAEINAGQPPSYPTQSMPPSPPPGSGGRAEVYGNRSGAIGGPAGESGIYLGGPGGDAIVRGDNSLAIGGQGGGAPQANGRGGKGGMAALGLGYNTILPDGHRLSDFGRGGDGGNTPEYNRNHWPTLSINEMVALYPSLMLLPKNKVNIVCEDDSCIELAESLIDLFGQLRWLEPTLVTAKVWTDRTVSISPDNQITRTFPIR